MFKRYLVLAAVATMLAACSSGVKLDPPIDGDGTSGAHGESSVTQVHADGVGADALGPTGVARVIYFDFDSYVVRPEYQSVVDGNAQFLQTQAGSSVVLEGNTDARGSREYNLALGQRRAEAVRRSMTLVGASDSQIEAVSFGKENLAVDGYTEDAHAQNRRVEIRYR